jgi:hypothetical protein
MKQFTTIEILDTAILYILELAASISVLLRAFGLIASMANVLTKGAVLTDHLWMQQIWAWTQCIAIDDSVAGTIIWTFRFYNEGVQVKTWLYGLLSVLLLFTAAIVSNIEAVQQTLNITLDAAYIHVFVQVEALIRIRSLAIVLLIVAHSMRHVSIHTTEQQLLTQEITITPQIVETLRSLILEVTITQEQQETPQIPETTTGTAPQEEGTRGKVFTQLANLLPDVTDEEKEVVLEAYNAGVQRRNICGHLHWGSAKYSTIVKPVLDAYEKQAQQAETE